MKKINRNYLLWLILPLLVSFGLPQKKPLRIFLAGDSTMQPYDTAKTPQRGWGQVLYSFFDDETLIVNKARGGRSTKSFIAEGLWQGLIDSVRTGDYVFIEFGHNDASVNKPERYTPVDQYERNLRRMIHDVRDRNGVPILLTPIARRNFDKEGHYKESHAGYLERVKNAGKDVNVPVIDLDSLFGEVIAHSGSEDSKKFFMHFGPGLYRAFPQGHKDDTHLRQEGAEKLASLCADWIRKHPVKDFKVLQKHLK